MVTDRLTDRLGSEPILSISVKLMVTVTETGMETGLPYDEDYNQSTFCLKFVDPLSLCEIGRSIYHFKYANFIENKLQGKNIFANKKHTT